MEAFEKRLLLLSKKGDRQAFGELVDLYKDRIFGLAYRMLGDSQEAEDVLQDTFLRIYTNLDRYDEKYKISTWIFRIANNLCIDRIRKRKARTQNLSLDAQIAGTEGLELKDMVHDREGSPEQQVIQQELQGIVQAAVLSLPPKYRTVMILRYIQDLSIQEISEITGLPVATVKTQLHRGREFLRKKLQGL